MSNHTLRRVSILPLSIALILGAASCARNPVTGESQLMLISEEQEIAMGREADQQITAQYGVYDHPGLNQYIDTIGQEMATLSHRPELDYEFKVLDTEVVNAFAVPGGYIYVTRGILGYLNSEAELAGVLGHEIGHVTARHTASRMSKQMAFNVGLGVGSIVSEEFAQAAKFAKYGVQVLFLKYSRDDERQSDRLGVEYSSQAGYDAHKMANFFNTLERLNPGGGALPGFFSTHPNPEDRVEAINDYTDEFRQKRGIAAADTVARERYLRAIEGIAMGENPRDGYTEGNTFYHPNMRFYFPFPRGWDLTNMPQQVQIVSPDENAFLLLQVAKATSARAAAEEFVNESEAEVRWRDPARINGLSAYRVRSKVEDLEVLSTFYELDNRVLVLHGGTNDDFGDYANDFELTHQGMDRLTDRSKIDVDVRRLRIKPAPPAGNVRGALQDLGVSQNDLEKTAIMNGLNLDESVEAGYLLKVVE
jgi:predicted Zn-dependent protease